MHTKSNIISAVTAAVSVFTAAASCWLVVMYFVLKHPGYQSGAAIAGLFFAQSVLNLIAISRGSGIGGLRYLVLAGGCGIIWAGASAIQATLSSSHFEGYALIIGFALVVQGGFTLVQFAWPRGQAPATTTPAAG